MAISCFVAEIATPRRARLRATTTPTRAMNAKATLLLLVSSYSRCACLQAVVGRRGFAIGAAASLLPAAAVGADDTTSVTKMDAFQLRASIKGLDEALASWRVEIAQVQLGNEPSSVVAVAGLGDSTLQHFAADGLVSSVEAFKTSRNGMLQMLYLARGAARYEQDPKVALDYIDKARIEAEAASEALRAIASGLGVTVSSSSSAAAAAKAEDKITFQPREAPKVENRLVF